MYMIYSVPDEDRDEDQFFESDKNSVVNREMYIA